MWLCLLLHAAVLAQENRKAVEEDSGISRFMSLDFSSKCLGCCSKDKERRDPELVWKKHLLHLRNSCQQTKGHGQKDAKTWSSQCQSSMVSHPKRGWLDDTCSYLRSAILCGFLQPLQLWQWTCCVAPDLYVKKVNSLRRRLVAMGVTTYSRQL